MNDDINPVANQIDALTGGSLANKVDAPKEEVVPVDVDAQGVSVPEDVPDVQAGVTEEQEPVIDNASMGQITPDSLENVQDPVSYNRRRFEKVKPYVATMPNGDIFETDTLDKDKLLYNYYKELRGTPGALNERENLVQRANKNYFGYTEVPEGIEESFFGAAGRGAVNIFTNLPFDIYSAAQMGGTEAALKAIDDNQTLTAEQKTEIKQKIADSGKRGIETALELKNDFTAHPTAYWVDVRDNGWGSFGAGVGSVAASVLPAYFTGGASLTAGGIAKAGTAAATRAATKKLGKEAVKKMGKEAVKETAETMAKRAINIKQFVRNPNFDPTTAKKSLALIYTNRIANASNYLISAGEAAGGAVEVYEDTLAKTNDIDLAVNKALSAGGIVGVLGAAPEWAHGAFGALFGVSRKMTAAALRGDKRALRWMIAGNVGLSGGLEGASEVLQDVTVAGATNKPLDPAQEWMTFALASIMAGSMTAVSNRNAPSEMIKGATEWKENVRAALKVRAANFNAMLPEGAKLITDENIDALMEIVDDPNFDTLAEKVIKKGILENVDKMEGMPDEDKSAFLARLEDPDVDVSTRTFEQFDRAIDNTYLKDAEGLTPAQRAIFKSIMHGVARYGILSGRISSPMELLYGYSAGDLSTGGTASYTEDGTANIATEGGANLAPYSAAKVDENAVAPGQRVSARVNNQIESSATKGMTQGSVDILHEVLGHLFASDILAKEDLPHFLVRYTELLQEAIKEVMPKADIESATPEELDEYRAYAMANSSKIAEMLGFKGDTAKLFGFFEQMALADSANFGAIKEYVQTLRALLEENSMAMRAMVDNYGEDLPAAIKHYADTGEVGMLTNEDLKALSRIFQTGLADSDAKLDLMSIVGDNNTFQTLTDRLGKRFDTAVDIDKAEAKAMFDAAMTEAKDDIKNAPNAPVNEEAVETLDELEKEAEQTESQQEEVSEEQASEEKKPQELTNNQVTFDGKKYYYLTKKPLVMPNQEAVKEVKHTKEEGEPASEDKETYRASQLATTGLTKEELDGFTRFAVDEIKKNAPDIFDELIKQIDQIVESDTPVIKLPITTSGGEVAGYEFKYFGEIPVGNSKLTFDKTNAFSNENGRKAALSSDIAYYIMAKRAAKADNRRYSVRAINGAIQEYLKNGGETNPDFEDAAARLTEYEDQYFVANTSDDSVDYAYKSILEDLRDSVPNFKVSMATAKTGASTQEDLLKAGDWYESFYNKVSKAKDVASAKAAAKDGLRLSKEAAAELEGLSTQDEVVNFVQAHSNDFKFIRKQTKKVNEERSFHDLLNDEIDLISQDQNAESREIASWYASGDKLTSKQKKQMRAASRMAKAQTPEERAKAIAEFMRTKAEAHTSADDSTTKIFSGHTVDSMFQQKGYKTYTPMTRYKSELGYAGEKAVYNPEAEGTIAPKYTAPEEYGFNNRADMDAVFATYNIPGVTFDTQSYLYAPKTGKANQSGVSTLTDFLQDYADMASKQIKEMIPGYPVSIKDRLTYVRGVIDAYEAGKTAYDEYTKGLQQSATERGFHVSKNGNNLLNPEGYAKLVSDVEANGTELKKSLLFKDMDDGVFDWYSERDENPQFFPVNNTKYLTLGRVVQFPYGMNPRTGMIVMSIDVPSSIVGATHDKLFLFRTASIDSKGNPKYEEFFIPRSEFEEFFNEGADVLSVGNQVLVSDGVFDDIGRANFNKAFDEKLAKESKFEKAVDVVEDAVKRASIYNAGENAETLLSRMESAVGKKRYAAHEAITPAMAELLKQMTPADSEFADYLTPEELELSRERGLRRNLNAYAFSSRGFGQAVTQEEFTNALSALELSKELDKKSVSDFANEPYMGMENIIGYIDGLAQKANDARFSNWIHQIPLFLGSMSGTDRVIRMLFGGDDPLSKSLAESAQIMTQASELATEHLQTQIAAALKDKGGAESFNEFFRGRLTNSPVQAVLHNGKKVDIRRGEIQTLYAAKLIEETKKPNDPTKYKYEQSVLDGGNQIYSRLKNKMYKNADELVDQLTDTEKYVVESMLDFFTKYSKEHGKRFVLSLGSYVKSSQKGWELRQQYFTRATKAEMTDMNSLLLAGDLFDTMNGDFKANAIYESGVKKNLTAMKNMLLFGLNYSNAEDGLSGYERFLKDFKLRGDSDENSEDFQKFQQMLESSNNLREAVRQTLGKFGFERFMKRLDQEEGRPETAFKLLPTGLGKFLERTTRASMASKLAFKPKNALQNFMGAWQRLCPLADSTGKWYTTDLLDAMVHIKEAVESAKDNTFIAQRYSRNALGEEYQKVTDVSSTESTLAELSIWAKNKKAKGGATAAEIFGKLDDFAKKMTKISVGYGTSGADFLALAMGWYKLKPSLQKQAAEMTKANAKALNGKGPVSAEQLFMNHVLRNISSSNFMTRSPLQNWAIRNHMGALTAFLNDSLQSYGAIGESWYNYHNAKTDAEKRYYRRVITSNIASQAFYVATQIGALSALYGWVATDDGLTDAEQEYLWDALWREMVGQVSSVTPLDSFTRPMLEALFLKEKRQGGNVLTSTFQDLFADIHDGNIVGIISNMGDLTGFAGTRRAIDVTDALWSAYSKDDQSYKIVGDVLFGKTKNTAMKSQGLRKNSKGDVVEKKKRK